MGLLVAALLRERSQWQLSPGNRGLVQVRTTRPHEAENAKGERTILDTGPAIALHLATFDAELDRHVGGVLEAVRRQGLSAAWLGVTALAEIRADAGHDDGVEVERVVEHAQSADAATLLRAVARALLVAAVVA